MKYIFTCGFGWSGSSAIVDLLRELDGFWESETEFRLVKERYGLQDLEYAMTENWDQIETDMAIQDFQWLIKHLNHSVSSKMPMKWFDYAGLGYEDFFEKDFLNKTEKFLDNFIVDRYLNDWCFWDFKVGDKPLTVFFNKVKKKLKVSPSRYSYMTSPCSREEYYKCVKSYMDALFEGVAKKYDAEYVILDQGVMGHRPEKAFDYFNNSKVVIIDRDPRDIYVDLIQCNGLIGNDLAQKDDAKKYIDWHKAMRGIFKQEHENILRLRFEGLVLDYEKTLTIIYDFLGISSSRHSKKREYFKPEQSAKNIGIWKTYKNQEVIKEIESVLINDCYYG